MLCYWVDVAPFLLANYPFCSPPPPPLPLSPPNVFITKSVSFWQHFTFYLVICSTFKSHTFSLRTIGAVVDRGPTIFCAGSPMGVRDVHWDLVFPGDVYILNGQIGHKKGISAKH